MPRLVTAMRLFAGVLLAGFALSACADMQVVEPVQLPPKEYRFGATVPIEFIHPAKVGVRCAERGATFMGLPGLNSGACADQTLITMPNPCYTVAGGWYAKVLCHELGHANGWLPNHQGGAWGDDSPIQPASESPQALMFADFQEIQARALKAVEEQRAAGRQADADRAHPSWGLAFGGAALGPASR